MPTNDLSKVFSKVAPKYDFLNYILSFDNDRVWRKELVNISSVGDNAKVLDLCCGTADAALEFSVKADSAQVIGIDFSHEMLKLGQSKIKGFGLEEQIRLIEADVFALPFKTGNFDIVSMAFGLRNLSDHRKGIREMVNMLKTGGRVVILEFSPPANTGSGRVLNFYLKNILPFVASIFGGFGYAYKYLSSSIAGFISPEQILNYMEAAGLKNLRFKRLTFGVVYLYYGEK